MEDIKKLAEDYYNFILKYDECFFKKYKKKETEKDEKALNLEEIINKELEKMTRPYISLTKGKEIEELEYILSNKKEKLKRYIKMFDFISDECYALAGLELEKYYIKNNLEVNPGEILNMVIKCIEQDKFDRKIFSEELIEKCNLMKEANAICKRLEQIYNAMEEETAIYERLDQIYNVMQESDSEEWE